MHHLPEGIAPRDVVQWLNNTWFMWNGDWVEFRDIGTTEIGTQILAANALGKPVWVPIGEALVHWPHCGSVNIGGMFAVHAYRTPAKIYSRSYTGDLVRVVVPLRWDLLRFFANDPGTADIVGSISGGSYVLLKALSDREYPSAQAGISMLLDKQRPSVALSPSVILASRGTSIHVFYRGKMVGELDNGKLRSADVEPIIERKLRKLLEGGA